MDPVSMLMAGTSIFGLGMKLFGAGGQAAESSKIASASGAIASDEEKVNQQREYMMELTARRQSMQNLRDLQQKNALGLAAATNQGAQFGTGLQGAYGQQSGEAGRNALNISQNLGIGRNIFGLDTDISQQKMGIASDLAAMGMFQGAGAIGTGLMQGAGSIGNLFGNMFMSGSSSGSSLTPDTLSTLSATSPGEDI